MLNEALKAVRKFHRVSVQDAAAEMGVSASYVSEIENGKKRIHQDMLEAYSRMFNLPVSSFYLISESSEKHPAGRKAAISRKISKIINWIAED